jgi:nitroimidazol reductase NimA-like FMN-containing flavoprotein (pyridoxamine 5'-phosphate oxidase superfamily)
MPAEQRRGRKIAMTKDELDAFLAVERTCRVATTSPQGPHLTALWFGWDGTALWIYSIVRSQRWTDLQRDGRVAVLVDAGAEYGELLARKYHGTDAMKDPDGRHAWLKLVPDKITTWDFRKLPG